MIQMKPVTVRFEEVSTKQVGEKKCAECGSTIKRTFEATQTINPWNQKTPEEIRAENRERLPKDISKWQAKEEICAKCEKQKIPEINLDFDMPDCAAMINEYLARQEEVHSLEVALRDSLRGKAFITNTGLHAEIDCFDIKSDRVLCRVDVLRKNKKEFYADGQSEYFTLEAFKNLWKTNTSPQLTYKEQREVQS